MTGEGDDLWIISLLSLHRLIHKGCLCVCEGVCGCYYKSPVRLADTLSRLRHHVLPLLAISAILSNLSSTVIVLAM